MPRYDFRCHDCTTVFEETRSMARAAEPAPCPQCGSSDTYKLLSQIAFVSGNGAATGSAATPVDATMSGVGCGCGSCGCGAH